MKTKGKNFLCICVNWILENVIVMIHFSSEIGKWFRTHRCLLFGELEELTYVINKETSVFIEKESFEERDTDFIILVLCSHAHLLLIPKFLQFWQVHQNPGTLFSLWYHYGCSETPREMCDAVAGGQVTHPAVTATQPTGVLCRQRSLKGPTQLDQSISSAAPLQSRRLQNTPSPLEVLTSRAEKSGHQAGWALAGADLAAFSRAAAQSTVFLYSYVPGWSHVAAARATLDSEQQRRGISTFLTYWYLRGNETKLRLTFFPQTGSLPLQSSLFFTTANSPATHSDDVNLLLLLPAFTSESVLQFSRSSRDLPCPSLFLPLLLSGLRPLRPHVPHSPSCPSSLCSTHQLHAQLAF